MGRHATGPTRTVLQALQQHGDAGLQYNALAAQLAAAMDRPQLSKVLATLRARGLAHSQVTGSSRDGAQWFAGPGTDPLDIITPADHKRIDRARQLDMYQPMRFYGEGLVAPRAPSVWAYASSFLEVAPAC